MTNPEKLNRLLHVLLWTHQEVLKEKPLSKKITFAWLCNTTIEVFEKWEISFLRKILLNDGYIIMGEYGDGEPPEITHAGIKFIQSGGYAREAKQREIDGEIKNETLKSFKTAKTSLVISILGLIISTIISVFALKTSNANISDKDLNKFQNELESLKKDQKKQFDRIESRYTSSTKDTLK